MKKTIEGKTYNTDTAEEIAVWQNGDYCTDLNYCSEDLYKTPKGAYFVVGEGGARSKYASSCGPNSWGSGVGFTVLSELAALQWCEEHDCQYAIEDYFSHLTGEA